MGYRLVTLLVLLALVSAAAAVGAVPARADGTPVLSALATMSTVRSGARAATLSDGRVLIVGGDEPGAASGTVPELYDPAQNTWTQVASPGFSVAGAVVAALPGDRALVAGGSRSSAASAEAEIYDASTGRWSAAAAMPQARENAASATLPDGRVLVTGGFATSPGTQALTSTVIYDPGANSWSSSSISAGPAGAPAAAALPDGRVFVPIPYSATVGGALYDPATDTWTSVPSDTDAIYGSGTPIGAASLPDGRVAILLQGAAGGRTGQGEVYDPASGTITHETLPVLLYTGGAVAVLPGGRVLIAGGNALHAQASYNGFSSGGASDLADAFAWDPDGTGAGGPYPPAIDGTAYVGQTLIASPLTTTSAARSYQWLRCTTSCVADPDATLTEDWGSAMQLTPADAGARIEVVMTEGGVAVTAAATPAIGAVPFTLAAAPGSARAQTDGVTPGAASIPVIRPRVDYAAHVDYRVSFNSPGGAQLYAPITGTLRFDTGDTSESIVFPDSDFGTPLLAASITVQLSNPVGGLITAGDTATFPLYAGTTASEYLRAGSDPLALGDPRGADPLSGAQLFVDHQSIASRVAYLWRHTNPAGSAELDKIALEPGTTRFGAWDGGHPGHAVATFLARAARQEPGTVPLLATYRIVDGQCHAPPEGPNDAAAYASWIHSLAEGIGTHPAVLFLEMDSLITTPCLSRSGLAIRLEELSGAVSALSVDPHLVVYLDAGAADALRPARAARLLKAAGVARTQGFFLNSTHFDWTQKEINYGHAISKLIGGKHFVINTAENGQGPLIPKDRAVNGNEVLCNPPGRGLGPRPSTRTGYADVDAFAWIANPGVSGGPCRPGAPRTGVFWPAEAVSLAEHADFSVR